MITLPRVVLAELVKLRSVRSVVYALVAAALAIVAGGVFAAVGMVVAGGSGGSGGSGGEADPLGGSLTGVTLTAYILAAVGVLAVTGEYSGGTIRSTVAAVPRRALLVLGKVVAVVAVVLPLTVASILLTFLTARQVVGPEISWTAPGVLRALIGAALYLTVVAVLGVGFGLLLRSTAGAVALLIGVLTLPPLFAVLLPDDLADRVVPLLPDPAGTAVLNLTRNSSLHPWVGFAVFVGYAAATVAGATLLFRHRDA